MMTLKTVFGCDLRTLALFRIGLGIALFADLIDRGRDLQAHYTYWGVVPPSENLNVFPLSWIQEILGSVWFGVGLFGVTGCVAVAVILGYKTRLVTIIGWFLLILIQGRNGLVLTGGDNLLLFLFFWAIFLPLGARYSCDAAVDPGPSDFPNSYFSMGTVAILLQVACLYFFSALQKSVSSAWIPDGTILYYVFHLKGFVLPLGEWLLQFPALLQCLTYFVWVLELIGPFFLFSPWRFLPLRLSFLFMFVALHIGIVVCMNVGLFPLNNFVSLLLFIPSWCWDRLSPNLYAGVERNFTIYFDGDCEFCRKMCLLLKTFLVLPHVPIVPAQEFPDIYNTMEQDNTWVVQDQDETQYTHWNAFLFLVQHSPIFWLLARVLKVSPLRAIGSRAYKLVAKNRGLLSRMTRVALPYSHHDVQIPTVMNVVVGVLAGYMVFINLTNVPHLPFQISDPFHLVKRTLKLNQKWHMFSTPRKWSIWYVIPGSLINGTVADVYNGRLQAPSLENMSYEQSPFPNNRWRKYFENLPKKKNREHLTHFSAYLCRTWNENHPPLQHLLDLRIYFILEHTPELLTSRQSHKPKQEKFLLWEHSCLSTPS